MNTNSPTRSMHTRRAAPTGPLRRSRRAAFVRAHLFAVDIDRTKAIDRYIDYFGSGRAGRTLGVAGARGGSTRD